MPSGLMYINVKSKWLSKVPPPPPQNSLIWDRLIYAHREFGITTINNAKH